jgi:hypothetical protein
MKTFLSVESLRSSVSLTAFNALSACRNRSFGPDELEKLAGTQGFEPRYADPESAVLPLNDVPAGKNFILTGGCLLLTTCGQ